MNLKNFTAPARLFSFLLLFLVPQLGVEANNRGTLPLSRSPTLPLSHSPALPLSPSLAQKNAERICPAELAIAIDAIANRPQFSRARWGILIQTLSPSGTLYNREAQRYFIPASNVKLLTTAAALLQLGSQYRIRTSIYGSEEVLRVVGRGDPSLKDEQLRDLAQQLKRRGIRQVRQLIVEEGYFQGAMLPPSWEWEDVYAYYGAPVNSLILNENAWLLTLSPQAVGQPLTATATDSVAARQWRVENNSVTAAPGTTSSIEVSGVLGELTLRIQGQLAMDAQPETLAMAVRNPAQYFLQHFRLALAAEGITVAQASVAATPGTQNQPELAAVESPPVSQLIADTNQPSNNIYAEALLRSLGVANPNAKDAAENGLNAIKTTLTPLGVDPTSYVLADGSGLSRHNLVSPEALVQMLRGIAQSPQANLYRTSLPVAGISGTLKNRLQNTGAQGIVQAKTGTMSGVVALSGYLNPPDYQPLVFSIIVNQSDQSAAPVRQAIDEIVLLLVRLRRC